MVAGRVGRDGLDWGATVTATLRKPWESRASVDGTRHARREADMPATMMEGEEARWLGH